MDNKECGTCGADLEPSTTYRWHGPDETCKACKGPLELTTQEKRYAERMSHEGR